MSYDQESEGSRALHGGVDLKGRPDVFNPASPCVFNVWLLEEAPDQAAS